MGRLPKTVSLKSSSLLENEFPVTFAILFLDHGDIQTGSGFRNQGGFEPQESIEPLCTRQDLPMHDSWVQTSIYPKFHDSPLRHIIEEVLTILISSSFNLQSSGHSQVRLDSALRTRYLRGEN